MGKKQFAALLYGWIVTLGLILVSSFILALLLRFTMMDESVLFWTTLAVGIVSLFVGGFVAGVKGKQKGWMIGCLTGAGFTLFIFLIQYLGYQEAFSTEQSLYHLGYILAAIVGGVFGVNTTSAAEEH